MNQSDTIINEFIEEIDAMLLDDITPSDAFFMVLGFDRRITLLKGIVELKGRRSKSLALRLLADKYPKA